MLEILNNINTYLNMGHLMTHLIRYMWLYITDILRIIVTNLMELVPDLLASIFDEILVYISRLLNSVEQWRFVGINITNTLLLSKHWIICGKNAYISMILKKLFLARYKLWNRVSLWLASSLLFSQFNMLYTGFWFHI